MHMDVRGRGDSDGVFEPWRNEGQDGFDSIAWVAEQPWCDGDVITWGQSYLGCIQWMTALLQPPHLRAMIVYVAPSDPFEDNPTGGPIPWEVCWLRMLDGRVQQYVEGVDWPTIAWHLPLITMDEHAGYSAGTGELSSPRRSPTGRTGTMCGTSPPSPRSMFPCSTSPAGTTMSKEGR